MNEKVAKELIEYATRAPSGHNSQPWYFTVKGELITISPDYAQALPVVDPQNRELFISLGAATENLVLAANDYGYKAQVDLFPHNTDEIQVHLEPKEKTDTVWLELIRKRQSNRRIYSDHTVAASSLKQLKAVIPMPGTQSNFIIESSDIEKLIALVKAGNTWQMNNLAFKRELVQWIRFDQNEARKKGDGLSNLTLGNPSIPFRWLGEFITKLALTPTIQNQRDLPLLSSAAGFIVFSVDENTKAAWVNLGRHFERLALEATGLDIAISHFNQPFEVPNLAERLKEQLGLPGKYPCLMVRFGHAEPMPYSLRRPIESRMK